jgi:hypothetical protein
MLPREPFRLPNPPPVPLSATYYRSTGIVIVLFDSPLQAASLAAASWVVTRTVPKSRNVLTVSAAGTAVTITTSQSALSAATDQVRYDGLDPTFTGTGGTPVAAFTLPYNSVP